MALISQLRHLLSPRPRAAAAAAAAPEFRAPLAPDRPFVAVGDIHGRADLLEALLARIRDQAGARVPLVFLGDYIDRGEGSAAVLAHLQALQRGGWGAEVVCLSGNHEAMMLDFLDAPETGGPLWLHNGGAQTLASFGVYPPGRAPDALRAARDDLRTALPPGTEAWLRALPLHWRSGNVFAAHAGADPNTPLDQQDAAHLLWGHPEFERTPRTDGIWVAHGHTIRDTATAHEGRIGLDTGAYATNRLSAALIAEGECRFLTTGA